MNTKIIQVVLVLALIGCINHQPDTLCTEIIDGDTFRLENGELVRLIGIDAPELGQPGGELSREYLAHLILGKQITLERGLSERDKYDRLLLFVYIGDLCVNEEMIRQGYAEARYLSENPTREYYIQLEIEAEHNKVDWDTTLPVIAWFNADKYYNQYIIVEGVIVDVYNSGRVCFLNFCTDYHYFTAVIFACDFLEFPEVPEVYYLGKKVQILGIIKEYKGSPEIILKTPDQIKIIGQGH